MQPRWDCSRKLIIASSLIIKNSNNNNSNSNSSLAVSSINFSDGDSISPGTPVTITFNNSAYASVDGNQKITITEDGTSTAHQAKNTQKFTFSGSTLTINHNWLVGSTYKISIMSDAIVDGVGAAGDVGVNAFDTTEWNNLTNSDGLDFSISSAPVCGTAHVSNSNYSLNTKPQENSVTTMTAPHHRPATILQAALTTPCVETMMVTRYHAYPYLDAPMMEMFVTNVIPLYAPEHNNDQANCIASGCSFNTSNNACEADSQINDDGLASLGDTVTVTHDLGGTETWTSAIKVQGTGLVIHAFHLQSLV